MIKKGFFIVLEGPDRCGKSTQAALLVNSLKEKGFAVLHTREPGGTPFAEAIRNILLDTRHKVAPLAELLLYEAARAQHTRELILPSLESGKIVISERYAMATVAYQGYGRKIPLGKISVLNRIATDGTVPDLTVVLDVPDREFICRGKHLKSDRLELESGRFRKRVRDAYRLLSRTGRNTKLIDGAAGVEEVRKKILEAVLPLLKRRKFLADFRRIPQPSRNQTGHKNIFCHKKHKNAQKGQR